MIETLPAAALQSVAETYLLRLSDVLRSVPMEPVEQAIELLLAARDRGSCVYLMGNGGSAATASHIATDLLKTSQVPGRRSLKTFALTDNVAMLTAWANDTAYERVFAEQLSALLEPLDVVIAVSASGNSPNIVKGLAAASALGAHTIALVGFDGGAAGMAADVAIHIRSFDYGLVEDAHMATGHAISMAIRRALQDD